MNQLPRPALGWFRFQGVLVKTNQEKAKAYYGAVNRYDLSTIEAMVTEDYIQHNPHVPTGRAAFLALFPKLREHGTQIENLRIFQDGCYVVMHHLWRNARPFGSSEKVAFHIIRFDQDGLIAEHWSVMMDPAPLNPSGRSLIDGPTRVEGLEETDANKAKVVELFELLMSADIETLKRSLPQFFWNDYHEHHPRIGDGVENLLLAIRDVGVMPVYQRQHRVFGSGNFVLSIAEGLDRDRSMAIYDLFGFEKGLIAERWTVQQEIPHDGFANQNTMFGFRP